VTAYVIRRVLQAIVILFGVSLITFIMIHLLPGGPRAMLGIKATPPQVHAFLVANGYNKPIWTQYVAYIGHILSGNFGYSYPNNETVLLLLEQNLPKSALLVGLSAAASLIVAVPLGLFQALRRNTPEDYVLTAGAFVGYSMPLFWLGTLLILIFAVNTHVLLPEGPQGSTVGTLLNQPRALVLPVATLTIVTVALWSRYMRSSAVDNLVQDYIRTARAKGASEARVLFGHLLRNALLPIITLIGLSLPAVLSGEVITESVFNYPGMGLLFWNAATTHDYPVLMGVTIVVGAAVVIGSLLADILYAVVDPRVRTQ
jgi:peptide/nickel transport system permease protein